MDTKNYNKATAYFRKMEHDHPDEKQWGEFVDAMDSVMERIILMDMAIGDQGEIVGELVRCCDCKHRDPEDHKCDCGHDIQWQLPRADNWFCADGKRKEGR